MDSGLDAAHRPGMTGRDGLVAPQSGPRQLIIRNRRGRTRWLVNQPAFTSNAGGASSGDAIHSDVGASPSADGANHSGDGASHNDVDANPSDGHGPNGRARVRDRVRVRVRVPVQA